ncbi:hypothetical protein ACFWDG_24160 [Peribacillus sp. NPDC060186]
MIDDEKLVELKNNLREWSKALSQKSPNSWTDKELESLLNQFSFTENKIVDYYTCLVKE